MAFPKKNSRKINVDGAQYIWMASGNDGYIDLIISSDQNNGQKLMAQFDYQSKENQLVNFSKQEFVITPFIVKQVILLGLNSGWTPGTKTSDLKLGFLDKKISSK